MTGVTDFRVQRQKNFEYVTSEGAFEIQINADSSGSIWNFSTRTANCLPDEACGAYLDFLEWAMRRYGLGYEVWGNSCRDHHPHGFDPVELREVFPAIYRFCRRQWQDAMNSVEEPLITAGETWQYFLFGQYGKDEEYSEFGSGVKNDLLQNLDTRLAPFGFQRPEGWRYFEREEDGQSHRFRISYVERQEGYLVGASVGLSHHMLEELVKTSSDSHFPPDDSIQASIGWLAQKQQPAWFLTNAAEVAKAAEELEQLFVEFALPFYERSGRLEAFLDLYARDDEEVRQYIPSRMGRAKRAVAAAYLLKNWPLLHEQAETKEQSLRLSNDRWLKHFIPFRQKMEDLTRLAQA